MCTYISALCDYSYGFAIVVDVVDVVVVIVVIVDIRVGSTADKND